MMTDSWRLEKMRQRRPNIISTSKPGQWIEYERKKKYVDPTLASLLEENKIKLLLNFFTFLSSM